MNFWLRNIILGILLIALAWAFFANQDFLLSLDHPENQLGSTEKNSADTANTNDATIKQASKENYSQGRKENNAAAKGLSDFYAKLYGEMDGDGPKIRNNIIYLPDPKGDLEQLLHAREMIVRPYKKNWRGSVESRPFRKGETLYQKLAGFSKKDGLELIWWLNRDYIVKDPFRIEKNILKTAYQIGKAIEGHFESGLSIYFCYRHRSVVVIESMPRPFLDEECTLLKADASY